MTRAVHPTRRPASCAMLVSLALGCLLAGAGCRLIIGDFGDENANNSTPVTCGDGVLDTGEQCDQDELNGQDCGDHGYYGGTLSCKGDCQFDTSACVGSCGDGVLDVTDGEECDQSEFDGRSCFTEVDHASGGTLNCNEHCEIEVTSCTVCGDDVVDANEECDNEELDGATCQDFGIHTTGTPTCDASCLIDASSCASCDDGVCHAEVGENQQDCPADCGWVHLSAGDHHTCGVRVDGSGWCWGNPEGGWALGLGPSGKQLTPQRVSDIDDWVLIEASDTFSCGSSASLGMRCWGVNSHGQLGTGLTANADVPQPLLNVGASPAAAIALGDHFGCALVAGTVWCWGQNQSGQLGRGTTSAYEPQPQMVGIAGATGTIIDVVAGAEFACALYDSGQLWCWGDGSYGQLGTGGSSAADATPQHVANAGAVDGIGVGMQFMCSLYGTPPDNVSCWGYNQFGQLGIGSVGAQYSPQPWSTPLAWSPAGIDGGSLFACGHSASGEGYCWGSNRLGQSAQGEVDADCNGGIDHESPARIMKDGTTSLPGVVFVTAGGLHACAIGEDNKAYCWGKAVDGNLGIGQPAGDCIGYATPVAH